MNQCDGCVAGMPVVNGTHQYPEGVWESMVCTKDRYDEKFMYATVQELRDQTIRRYNTYPLRCRLQGMTRDLDHHDLRIMAGFEAVVEVLNRLGVLDRAKLDAIIPKPFTVTHEVNDEQTCGHNFTPQKK